MEETDRTLPAGSWENIGADWDFIESILSDLALADMASKAHLLRSVSTHLACVAETICFSAEHYLVSAWVGAMKVTFRYAEVSQLHELLVRELKDELNFIIDADESADGIFSHALHLEIVSQTLRCCIRILPLLDCFDISASRSTSKLLDDILQQLCSPTRLFNLLGLRVPDELQCVQEGCDYGPSFEDPQIHGDGGWCETTEPKDSRHRLDMILAILEVYLDELLLHPDWSARISNSQEHMRWLLMPEQVTCRVSDTEASLEAAFVHVLAFHSQPVPGPSCTAIGEGFLVCNLSLPAGLILLERLSGEDVPPFYIALIVRFLSRILNDTTPLDFSHVEELKSSQQNVAGHYLAGGVDWSYCSKERLSNFDLKDRRVKAQVLPSETTLNFVSSILEHAVLLYRRFSATSNTCKAGNPSTSDQNHQSPVLRIWLSKYLPLFNDHSENLQMDVIEKLKFCANCQCSASEALKNPCDVFLELLRSDSGTGIQCPSMSYKAGTCTQASDILRKEDTDKVSGLVAALLQLMSSAIECIGREISKLTWLPSRFDHPLLHGEAESNEADFDKILHCVGLCLSLCIPSDTSLGLDYSEPRCPTANGDGLDSQLLLYEQESLHQLVGLAIISFTNIFRDEVHQGASDVVLEAYFHLLESFVALLLALDVRNKSRQLASICCPGGDCIPSDDICRTSLDRVHCDQCKRCLAHDGVKQVYQGNNSSRFLKAMVLSLQGILEELSKQQRSMPEFFLCFIFKQIPKGDGLSFVAMVFSNCLKCHLDVEQIVKHSTEAFHSGCLVTQMMHLVLSDPTRSCSLLTFMVYMMNILQELLPITDTLSLSEIIEEIPCYENIACSLTLACHLAVHEQSLFIGDGQDYFMFVRSKMCEGIERLFTKGIAVANWLCDLREPTSEAAPQNLTAVKGAIGRSTIAGHGKAGMQPGNCAKYNSFLSGVDLLRKTVEGLANSRECLLGADLAPLLVKGNSFFMALLDLPANNELSECEWRVDTAPYNQQDSPVSVGQTQDSDVDQRMIPKTTVEEEIVRKFDMEGNNSSPSKCDSTTNKRKLCSSTTSAIIKRLVQKKSPSGKPRSGDQVYERRLAGVCESILWMGKSSRTINGQSGVTKKTSWEEDSSPGGCLNPFVDSLNKEDPGKDKFDDLKDFIVPKKGRDYSVWLKRRMKVRRRLYAKNILKRSQEKRDLLRLLQS